MNIPSMLLVSKANSAIILTCSVYKYNDIEQAPKEYEELWRACGIHGTRYYFEKEKIAVHCYSIFHRYMHIGTQSN